MRSVIGVLKVQKRSATGSTTLAAEAIEMLSVFSDFTASRTAIEPGVVVQQISTAALSSLASLRTALTARVGSEPSS
ncbi:hypothetical protein D3C71_953940 [compost metagenome]